MERLEDQVKKSKKKKSCIIKKKPGEVLFDVNLNATIRMLREDWDHLLEACDGDLDLAKGELEDDMQYSCPMGSTYGNVWACSATVGSELK